MLRSQVRFLLPPLAPRKHRLINQGRPSDHRMDHAWVPFYQSARRRILVLAHDFGQNARMNKRDLAKAVAVQSDVDVKTVTSVLEAFTDVVTHAVSKGEPVAIAGFAKFAKVERAARMGRNPATGEAIRIKASKKARITPVKAFKDAVLAPATAPKLVKGAYPTSDAAVAAAGKSAAPVAAKKAPARAAAKKAPARKATARKAPARRAPAKRTPARKAVKRAPAKRAAKR